MSRLGNRLPTCLACLRRLAQPSMSPIQLPTGVVLMQTRAKSNHMQPHDRGVVVRLLEDIPAFGRKHSVFRTERGRMRNQWYPANKAEYMTRERFQELGLTEEDVGERDRAYVISTQVEEDPLPLEDEEQPEVRHVSKKEVEAEHTLISTLTPETLTFYRKVIEKPASEGGEARSGATKTDASGLDIYGSVSTTDIANRIREYMVTDAEGRTVTVQAQNIGIVGSGGNALKTLGRWKVEIKVAGSEVHGVEPVSKVIEILPQRNNESAKP